MSSAVSSGSASRSATKRLLKELDTWHQEKVTEKGIERLGPVGEEDLFTWQAVINGHDIGGGYSGTYHISPSQPPVLLGGFATPEHQVLTIRLAAGRWLLLIKIPPQYPLHPPTITFSTPIVHPNIALNNGRSALTY